MQFNQTPITTVALNGAQQMLPLPPSKNNNNILIRMHHRGSDMSVKSVFVPETAKQAERMSGQDKQPQNRYLMRRSHVHLEGCP
jgi:hypothetical protein